MRAHFPAPPLLLALLLLSLVVGCTSLNRPQAQAAKAAAKAAEGGLQMPADRAGADTMLQQAQTLYQNGQFADALRALVDASRRDPTTPGLRRMQRQVMQALLDQRSVDAASIAEQDRLGLALETLEKGQVPPSYNVKKAIGPGGGNADLPASMTSGGFGAGMQNVLNTPVTLSLKGADLPALIQALSQVPGVNLIADEALGADKKINVEVEDVPLREVLDYIAGNFGIRYHYGQNTIWASSAEGGGAVPLITRVFKLQQGVQFEGNAWGLGVQPKDDGGPVDDDVDRISNKATVLSERPTYIETVISNFVPRVEGAKIHFDRNTHSLFVRDTPDNIQTIEALVETLDVTPPQVFIEARAAAPFPRFPSAATRAGPARSARKGRSGRSGSATRTAKAKVSTSRSKASSPNRCTRRCCTRSTSPARAEPCRCRVCRPSTTTPPSCATARTCSTSTSSRHRLSISSTKATNASPSPC